MNEIGWVADADDLKVYHITSGRIHLQPVIPHVQYIYKFITLSLDLDL